MRDCPPAASGVATGDLPLAILKHLHRGDSRGLASLLLRRRREIDEAARFLVDERLGVWVYAATRSLSLDGLWPGPALARLRDQWVGQRARTTLLMDSLSRISRRFSQERIEYLLLKGLPMANRFQGGMDHRFTWDLDVLVRESDVARALDVLAGIGVRSPPLTRRLQWAARRVAHALECRGPDGSSVDLHWAFRRLPGTRFPVDDVFGNRRFLDVGGLPMAVPSDEHVLVQVLLGIAADVDRGLCRLRTLWDAYLLLLARPVSDWSAFFTRREEEGCSSMVANAIALVVHRMDASGELGDTLGAVVGHRGRSPVLRPDRVEAILARPPHSLRNHFEFAAWQDLPRWRYWAWWAATWPGRVYFARRW